MKNEPVLNYGLIVAVISAGIAMLMQLEVINLTNEQFTGVMAFVGAVAVLGAAIVRQWYTTPVSNPRDMDGMPLVRQDGAPLKKGL